MLIKDGQAGDEARIAVVVGLGNPGKQYALTRHNVGFRVVDCLARRYGINLEEGRFSALWGEGIIAGRQVRLLKPHTFMNRSGVAVAELVHLFGYSAPQILVVHDDLDLPCGRIRLVRKGGAGGHRGVLSIIEHLGSKQFPRVKLGIGRPLRGETVEAFVLEPPYSEEESLFAEMLESGVEAVLTTLQCGLTVAMNQYNRRESRSADS
jgi:PTH1 family peptidyl-tRNA hydrolase